MTTTCKGSATTSRLVAFRKHCVVDRLSWALFFRRGQHHAWGTSDTYRQAKLRQNMLMTLTTDYWIGEDAK